MSADMKSAVIFLKYEPDSVKACVWCLKIKNLNVSIVGQCSYMIFKDFFLFLQIKHDNALLYIFDIKDITEKKTVSIILNVIKLISFKQKSNPPRTL